MFVSVKEAVDLTGMSQTTIYRLCKKRSHTKYVKKKDNKYFIEREYLLATYPETEDDNLIIKDTQFERNALNTPQDEIIEFSDADSSELSNKIIDDISVKITQRFNESNEFNLDTEDNSNQQSSTVPWESIIGVSVGVLLIVGFILILYFAAK